MKIGVMTWYTFRNFGTALQASALCNILKRLGHEPVAIRYKPVPQIRNQKASPSRIFLTKLKGKVHSYFGSRYVSRAKNKLFDTYLHERLQETAPCVTSAHFEALNDHFDAFICGSDQIWSPLRYNDYYFLSFVKNTARMISYAPSMGTHEVKNADVRVRMAKQLARFEHLSVREQHGAAIIEELCGRKASVVVDPTLLLDAKAWDDCVDVDGTVEIDGDYLLCYFLGDSTRYARYVVALEKLLNLKVVVIPITKRQKRSSQAAPFEIGPREFVSLIRVASHICTDSFHGVAFSVNYQKPFTVFRRFAEGDPENQNSRIYSILQTLGLNDRLVNPNDFSAVESLEECDLTDTNKILHAQRLQSMRYLTEALDAVRHNAENAGR